MIGKAWDFRNFRAVSEKQEKIYAGIPPGVDFFLRAVV